MATKGDRQTAPSSHCENTNVGKASSIFYLCYSAKLQFLPPRQESSCPTWFSEPLSTTQNKNIHKEVYVFMKLLLLCTAYYTNYLNCTWISKNFTWYFVRRIFDPSKRRWKQKSDDRQNGIILQDSTPSCIVSSGYSLNIWLLQQNIWSLISCAVYNVRVKADCA